LKVSVKQWITLGFTLLMLVKAWVIPLVYLDYELRKEYIIANLCVNRDNPIVVCEGKCYLAEKVVEAKKQDERRAEQSYMANLLFQVMDTGKTFIFKAPEHFETRLAITFSYISPFLPRAVASEIFHPPLS
jgi:type III secretion system FlhB-like substrate exporter